jgi:uncharacterized protein
MLFRLGVGLYGGYLGAGIGILMLAALSILGPKDIHEMNALKVILGGTVNGIAAIYFIWKGMVYWPYVLVIAVGAIAGGNGGAGVARKLGGSAARKIVIGIGFAMGAAVSEVRIYASAPASFSTPVLKTCRLGERLDSTLRRRPT